MQQSLKSCINIILLISVLHPDFAKPGFWTEGEEVIQYFMAKNDWSRIGPRNSSLTVGEARRNNIFRESLSCLVLCVHYLRRLQGAPQGVSYLFAWSLWNPCLISEWALGPIAFPRIPFLLKIETAGSLIESNIIWGLCGDKILWIVGEIIQEVSELLKLPHLHFLG